MLLLPCKKVDKQRKRELLKYLKYLGTRLRKSLKVLNTKKIDAPFALFLKCCMELLPDDDQRGTQPSSRERVVTALFQKTCAEGLVSERVLSKLFTDKDLVYELTGSGDENYSKNMMEQLPSSWSSNVPESSGNRDINFSG